MISPKDVILVTPDILQSIPSSKYSDDTWEYIKKQKSAHKLDNDNADTTAYVDSDDTVIYWNTTTNSVCKRKGQKRKPRKGVQVQPQPPRRIIRAKPSAHLSYNFHVSTHRIHKCRQQSNLVCKQGRCRQ